MAVSRAVPNTRVARFGSAVQTDGDRHSMGGHPPLSHYARALDLRARNQVELLFIQGGNVGHPRFDMGNEVPLLCVIEHILLKDSNIYPEV